MELFLSPHTYEIFRHLAVKSRTKLDLSRITGLSLRSIGSRVRVLEEESLISHTNQFYFITEKGIDAMSTSSPVGASTTAPVSL